MTIRDLCWLFVIGGAGVALILCVPKRPEAKWNPQVVSAEEITTPLNVDHVFVVHDDKRNVTCYVTGGHTTSISCIPDAKMKVKE